MGFTIPVGEEGFENIRHEKDYYVDKTELIYELINNTRNKVTLFTRPRRFGKTLAMRMMESFFDITRDSCAVFEGLAVAKHEGFCREWMNQYPVVFVTFKGVRGETFETAYTNLRAKISDACKKMTYLAKSEKVDAGDLEIFKRLWFQKADATDITQSLLVMTRMLHAYYEKPVILLIDEYDVPLASADESRYYPQMLDIIRGIFENSCKTNEYLKFAVVTGCLRIAKESIFTGMNNFASYSVLDEDFSEYFGFTQPEVDSILKAAGREDASKIIRAWYDGYIFGSEDGYSAVYCPWDVARYVVALTRRKKVRPRNYWNNTSHNAIIKALVERKELDVTEKFETLMSGGTIRQVVSDDLTYDTLYGSEDSLWSVLLMTGYLTRANLDRDVEDDFDEDLDLMDFEDTGDTESIPVDLKIPNKEIASLFRKVVVAYFKEDLKKDSNRAKIQDLMSALWAGDDVKASTIISDFLWATISYNNYREDYYHAFLVGIFTGLDYISQSDKEHGLGRPDIVLRDEKNQRAIIIEAKKAESLGQMEQACQDGIEQIARQQYDKDASLDEYDPIVCYGVSFFKKRAMVKKMD